jgi:hypothetical protein
MTIGHGGANRRTDARNGMKTTDDPTRALAIRGTGRKDESLAIPKTMKATRAFQNPVSEIEGTYHSVCTKRRIAAVASTARRIRKLNRSNWGWLSPIVVPSVGPDRKDKQEKRGTPRLR